MHDDALAGAEQASDLVAGDRSATAREVHHHALGATDGETPRAAVLKRRHRRLLGGIGTDQRTRDQQRQTIAKSDLGEQRSAARETELLDLGHQALIADAVEIGAECGQLGI